MTPADPVAVAAIVAAILEDLGIRYVIGGSVASSLMGEPRLPLDLDLMITCDAHSVRTLSGAVRSMSPAPVFTSTPRKISLSES